MKDHKSDFPIFSVPENGMPLVYLDSGATTQRPLTVIKAVEDHYYNNNANPHRGVYELAMRSTDAHENARAKVADFINAKPDEIVFTQNSTESLNLIAYSYGLDNVSEQDEIVVYVAEHHSNLVPWQRVAKAKGATLKFMYPNEKGRLTAEELDAKITKNTKIVAVAMVSNVLGLLTPVDEIVKKAHANGAVVVLDCAQSVPHMKVDVKALDCDFAVFSGHKLYAPMGIGVLYGKYELLDAMQPFLSGGDMINQVHEQSTTYAETPRKFEAGTRNVGGEVGLAAAIDYIASIGWDEIVSHENALIEQCIEGMNRLGFINIYGEATAKDRHGVISFNVQDVHPHDTASILDMDGVCIRAGHHCAQPLMEYMHIQSCARASFAIYNTPEDVDTLLESLKNVRRILGFGS